MGFDYAQPDRKAKHNATVFQRNIFTDEINGRVKPKVEYEKRVSTTLNLTEE